MYKGVTIGYYARNGYFSSPAARTEIDRIAEAGIPWICLVCTIMQEQFCSTRMFRDPVITPGDDELIDIIGYAHGKGIQVLFRPMLECWDGTQRMHISFPLDGCIQEGRPFTYWQQWFENYTAMTLHYLRVAERCGCEAYSFDSELNATVNQNEGWLKLIDTARSRWNRPLTTCMINPESFFYESVKSNPDHWFRALDALGTSMYHPAADKPGATVDEMVAGLQAKVEECRKFVDVYGRDFYFGECGCCAVQGAAMKPYYWRTGGGYDGREQADYLQAVIRAFSGEAWWKGMFWWKWDNQNDRPSFHDDPAGNKDFSIYGKPALAVMSDWCRK